NCPRPGRAAWTPSATIGRTTMTPRYDRVVHLRARPVPRTCEGIAPTDIESSPAGLGPFRRDRGPESLGAVEFVLDLRPAPEVGHREQRLRGGEGRRRRA